MTTASTLGDRIQTARTQAGLSVGQLARLLDVSRSKLAAWEDNTQPLPLSRVDHIAGFCDVSPDWLRTGVSRLTDDDRRDLEARLTTMPEDDRAKLLTLLERL